MSELNTAPVPDFYGHTIFCDDIRMEIDGKITYVGAYNSGHMFVRSTFPITIPKFCFGISFCQRSDLFIPNLGLRIFLPGDNDEKASIEADLQTQMVIPDSPDIVLYPMIGSNLVLSPFTIEQPGRIRVRVLREGILHRIGTLSISQFPDAKEASASIVSEPPS